MPTHKNNSVLGDFSALVDFSNLINSSLDLNFSLSNLLLTCFGKFLTTRGLIALKNENGQLEVVMHKGMRQDVIDKFPECHIGSNKLDDSLFHYFKIPLPG